MKNGPYELIVPPGDYPGKRYRERYAYEHRVNWWKETGENPDDFPNHVVHHRDEEKRNNKPINLELKPVVEHGKHHARPKTMVGKLCLHCGTYFERRSEGVKLERKFCSRRCIGLYNHRKRKREGEIF
jgi:hypothetical protein